MRHIERERERIEQSKKEFVNNILVSILLAIALLITSFFSLTAATLLWLMALLFYAPHAAIAGALPLAINYTMAEKALGAQLFALALATLLTIEVKNTDAIKSILGKGWQSAGQGEVTAPAKKSQVMTLLNVLMAFSPQSLAYFALMVALAFAPVQYAVFGISLAVLSRRKAKYATTLIPLALTVLAAYTGDTYWLAVSAIAPISIINKKDLEGVMSVIATYHPYLTEKAKALGIPVAPTVELKMPPQLRGLKAPIERILMRWVEKRTEELSGDEIVVQFEPTIQGRHETTYVIRVKGGDAQRIRDAITDGLSNLLRALENASYSEDDPRKPLVPPFTLQTSRGQDPKVVIKNVAAPDPALRWKGEPVTAAALNAAVTVKSNWRVGAPVGEKIWFTVNTGIGSAHLQPPWEIDEKGVMTYKPAPYPIVVTSSPNYALHLAAFAGTGGGKTVAILANGTLPVAGNTLYAMMKARGVEMPEARFLSATFFVVDGKGDTVKAIPDDPRVLHRLVITPVNSEEAVEAMMAVMKIIFTRQALPSALAEFIKNNASEFDRVFPLKKYAEHFFGVYADLVLQEMKSWGDYPALLAKHFHGNDFIRMLPIANDYPYFKLVFDEILAAQTFIPRKKPNILITGDDDEARQAKIPTLAEIFETNLTQFLVIARSVGGGGLFGSQDAQANNVPQALKSNAVPMIGRGIRLNVASNWVRGIGDLLRTIGYPTGVPRYTWAIAANGSMGESADYSPPDGNEDTVAYFPQTGWVKDVPPRCAGAPMLNLLNKTPEELSAEYGLELKGVPQGVAVGLYLISNGSEDEIAIWRELPPHVREGVIQKLLGIVPFNAVNIPTQDELAKKADEWVETLLKQEGAEPVGSIIDLTKRNMVATVSAPWETDDEVAAIILRAVAKVMYAAAVEKERVL